MMMRRLLLATASLACISHAMAQSSPPWNPGALPTDFNWRGFWSTKQDVEQNRFDVGAMGAGADQPASVNDDIFENAITNAAAVNGSVRIPCGEYALDRTITATIQPKGALSIEGAGHECVHLNFSGANGIIITESDPFASLLAHDFTMNTTDTFGVYTAFNIVNPNIIVYSTFTGLQQNIIRNVFYRGNDAYGEGQDYWGKGLVLNNVSYTSVDQGGYWGALQSGVYKGTASLAQGILPAGADPTKGSFVAVVNFHSFQVETCDVGFLYSNYVQGATITGGSNYTFCNKGVDSLNEYLPIGYNVPDQLTVADSQFATFQVGINGKFIPELLVHDNVFIVLADSDTGIQFGQEGFSIHDNFIHSTGGVAIGTGVDETYGGFVGGNVHDNIFYALKTGIKVSVIGTTLVPPNVAITNIHDNTMSSNTDNYVVSDPNLTGITIHHPGAYSAAGALGGTHPIVPPCQNNIAGLTFTVIDQATTTFGAPVTSTSGGGFGANNWGTALCGSSGYTFH